MKYTQEERLEALYHAYHNMDFNCINNDRYRRHVSVIEEMIEEIESSMNE